MILLLPCLAVGALASVVVEEPPIEGLETIIAVTDVAGNARGGETVRVIHRPELAGETELAIGITDGRGRVRWTPQTGGVAHVRAGDVVMRLRVAPAGAPTGTLVLLGVLMGVGAGATTFGAFGRPG